LYRLSCTAFILLSVQLAANAAEFEMQECKQVVTVLEDALDPLGDEIGRKLAEFTCQKLEELAPLFDLKLQNRQMLQIYIPEDMKSFHKLTGRSFFTLAVYSSRRGIITQPAKALKGLKTRGKLNRTLSHELTHFVVHHSIGLHCPMWINEGLAQWFEGLRPSGKLLINPASVAMLERRWRSRGVSVAQRRRDYLISLELVGRLMNRVGQKELLTGLKDLKAYRDPLDLEIKRRTLREWLFSADLPEVAQENQSEIEVERYVDWEEQLAEEVGIPKDFKGKVYDFKNPEKDQGITPLPLDEMLEKAKKKKKKRKQRRP
jgi:hypothetical protein